MPNRYIESLLDMELVIRTLPLFQHHVMRLPTCEWRSCLHQLLGFPTLTVSCIVSVHTGKGQFTFEMGQHSVNEQKSVSWQFPFFIMAILFINSLTRFSLMKISQNARKGDSRRGPHWLSDNYTPRSYFLKIYTDGNVSLTRASTAGNVSCTRQFSLDRVEAFHIVHIYYFCEVQCHLPERETMPWLEFPILYPKGYNRGLTASQDRLEVQKKMADSPIFRRCTLDRAITQV